MDTRKQEKLRRNLVISKQREGSFKLPILSYLKCCSQNRAPYMYIEMKVVLRFSNILIIILKPAERAFGVVKNVRYYKVTTILYE